MALAFMAALRYADLRWMAAAQYVKAPLLGMLEGTVELPYQYRILIPWLISGAMKLGAAIGAAVEPVRAFYAAELISSFMLIVAVRWHMGKLLDSSLAAMFFSFLIFLVLPFNFILSTSSRPEFPWVLPSYAYAPQHFDAFTMYYPWDTPSILFFVLGLGLLRAGRMAPYYAVFILATLNRETSCFLAVAYLFAAYGEKPNKTIALHLAAQTAVWVAIKAVLYMQYGDHAGVKVIEFQPLGGMAMLGNPNLLPAILSNCGFLVIPCVVFYRRIGDRFTRRALLSMVPFFALFLLIGGLRELRDYGELIPFVLPATVLIAKSLLKSD